MAKTLMVIVTDKLGEKKKMVVPMDICLEHDRKRFKQALRVWLTSSSIPKWSPIEMWEE